MSRRISILPEREWYVRSGTAENRTETYLQLKRALDIALCVAALPLAALLVAACTVAIQMDSPGPVFFFQMRTGAGGRRFKMYKLRTMVRNAEELKSKYMHLNKLSFPDFKIANDPRVTRVGRFLRRTSLDELPQIFNVLLGDMTLVGSRPTSFSPERYQLWHTARLDAKPGLTGLWQISGRSEIDFDDRVRLDVVYLRNRSIWLDIRILMRTLTSVFAGRGAC